MCVIELQRNTGLRLKCVHVKEESRMTESARGQKSELGETLVLICLRLRRFTYLKCRETMRDFEKESAIPSFTPPDSYKQPHVWIRLKPETRSSMWVSHAGGRRPRTLAILYSFSKASAGSRIRSGVYGTQTGMLI